MKKFILATVAVACSLSAISCDAESATDPISHPKKINDAAEKIGFRVQASVSQNKNTTMEDNEGPDDQLFPLPIPKKK